MQNAPAETRKTHIGSGKVLELKAEVEMMDADILLEVIDGSDPESDRQHTVTIDTLAEIGAGEIPLLRVFNKSDLCEDLVWPSVHEDRIYLSARTGEGIQELLSMMEDRLWGGAQEAQYLLPLYGGLPSNVVSAASH